MKKFVILTVSMIVAFWINANCQTTEQKAATNELQNQKAVYENSGNQQGATDAQNAIDRVQSSSSNETNQIIKDYRSGSGNTNSTTEPDRSPGISKPESSDPE